MTKASDLFVQALEEEGVEIVFGIPGEENLDFLDSLSRSKIRLVLCRHEQAAGFMAATWGRFTGKVAVALATLGPGAMNLTTPAAYATLGGMPMLMVTGQKPIKSSKQGRFQILDVVQPLTKHSRQVVSGSMIPAEVREAIRLAEEEKPGATHIELPEDIADEETDATLLPSTHRRRPVPEDKAIAMAVEKIAAASAPILVLGAGANRKLTGRMLTKLIDKFGIPFVTTQLGKGAVDERHELFMGCAALSSGDFVHRAIEAADLIINVGHDVIEKPPFFMHPGHKQEESGHSEPEPVQVREGTEVIHVSFRSAEVDPVYFPQLEVIGDIANAIWQIKNGLSDVRDRCDWDFSRMMEVKRHHDENIEKGADDDRFPIYPQRLVADVRRVMPDDGIVCLDNGIYKIWFARNYRAHGRNTILLDNALASMGAGLPSAMAAHLCNPGKRVLAVCGDGGFLMNPGDLETAVREKMNVTCLILRDDAYGMIRWKQANMGLADYGLSFDNPDFCMLAASYGAKGHRVDSAAALAPLLEDCLSTDGVHLIDCPVDYSENDEILNKRIKELSAAI